MIKKLLLSFGLIAIVSLGAYAEKIVIEGSTTVLPIAQKAAEVFMDSHPDSDISVRGGGSGVGVYLVVRYFLCLVCRAGCPVFCAFHFEYNWLRVGIKFSDNPSPGIKVML